MSLLLLVPAAVRQRSIPPRTCARTSRCGPARRLRRIAVAAIEAVASWRYRVPNLDGRAPSTEVQATVTFR